MDEKTKLDEKFVKWKGIDKEKNKPVVARPLQCMVGCTSCEVWCIFNAISFPDKEYVKNIIKKKGILKKAKEDLQSIVKKVSNYSGTLTSPMVSHFCFCV